MLLIQIDFVAHDDMPYGAGDDDDIYKWIKDKGMYVHINVHTFYKQNYANVITLLKCTCAAVLKEQYSVTLSNSDFKSNLQRNRSSSLKNLFTYMYMCVLICCGESSAFAPCWMHHWDFI